MLPRGPDLKICFAHVSYQLGPEFATRGLDISFRHETTLSGLEEGAREADVLCLSGLWRNHILDLAPKLKFIQVSAAGTDQFPKDELRKRGIRLANGRGCNSNAVSDHALALILSHYRKLPEARDNQGKRVWRGMINDPARREDELAGKTIVVVGLGAIGGRIARLARAFDMRVIGIRRNPAEGLGDAHAVHRFDELDRVLPEADVVAIACPLTPETRGLMAAPQFARMKPTAIVVNVARGPCVDEPSLIAALEKGQIAGAGIDVTETEPLPATSPLWSFPNVLVTPHTAGETSRYEINVIDYLIENLNRLWRGETELHNQII